VLDSGAEGPGSKLQPRRCRVTVLGKLFTPIVPLFTEQRNWQHANHSATEPPVCPDTLPLNACACVCVVAVIQGGFWFKLRGDSETEQCNVSQGLRGVTSSEQQVHAPLRQEQRHRSTSEYSPILTFPSYFFLAYSLSYLSTSLRIDPLCFQAGCRKRRLNLALVSLC